MTCAGTPPDDGPTWPTSMRPEGYYDAGERIPVPTY